MTCKELETYLPDLAEDALDAETRARLNIDAHLQECPDCRVQLAQALVARRMAVRLRAQPARVPVGFEARVMARIQAQNFGVDIVDFSYRGWLTWVVELIDLVFDLLLGGRTPEPAIA